MTTAVGFLVFLAVTLGFLAGVVVTGRAARRKPHLVLVAFGCPKQDLFIERHLHELGCHVAVGVGGTFNFIIGRIKRSPMLWTTLSSHWEFSRQATR